MSSNDDIMSAINSEKQSRNVELHRATSMVGAYSEPIKPKRPLANFCAEILNLKVELIMFTYMFASSLKQVSSTTMIMDKVCLVHFNQPANVCSDLSNLTDLKEDVERLANNYGVGHAMIQLLPSSFLACFLGAWSDKYGRKLPIIVALIGITLDGFGSTVCAIFMRSRVDYYLIPAVFTGISGGMISVLTILYSYASDVTTFGKRTVKYALLEASLGLSMPLGQAAGGWIFKFTSYYPVFLISTIGNLICLLCVIFCLKETKGLENKDSWRVKFRHLWSTEPVVESFKATMKTRPNKGKLQILLLIGAMSIAVLTYAAGAIGYLYVYHLYNWSNTKYSTVSAIFSVLGTFAMLVSVPIFRFFKLGDSFLGVVGSASLLAKNIALALAFKVEIYFLGNLLGILGGLCTLAGRSRISKVIPKEDTGKVFAFLSTAESLLPIVSVSVISQIFNATLKFYPGAVYMSVAILLLAPFGIFIWLTQIPSVNYEDMHHSRLQEGEEEKSKNVENIN